MEYPGKFDMVPFDFCASCVPAFWAWLSDVQQIRVLQLHPSRMTTPDMSNIDYKGKVKEHVALKMIYQGKRSEETLPIRDALLLPEPRLLPRLVNESRLYCFYSI